MSPRKVLPWSTNKPQYLAVHYFDRASTDKQFCQLTVGLVETLSNLLLFFIKGELQRKNKLTSYERAGERYVYRWNRSSRSRVIEL